MSALQHTAYSPDLDQPLLGSRWIGCEVGDQVVSGIDLLKEISMNNKCSLTYQAEQL